MRDVGFEITEQGVHVAEPSQAHSNAASGSASNANHGAEPTSSFWAGVVMRGLAGAIRSTVNRCASTRPTIAAAPVSAFAGFTERTVSRYSPSARSCAGVQDPPAQVT